MASLLDFTKPHLAYYSVPAALLLAFLPSGYKMATAGKHADTAMPRRVLANLEKDPSIDKQMVLRLQRADAASANAFETIGLYAGGIAAAGAAGVPASTLNYLGVGYVASRLVYNVVYVFLQDNRKFAPVRSLVWNVGLGVIVTLWIKAGNAAAAK
ncbi:hypothetical protein N0V82_000277 [Gnomoniopsis sp. IMI 355080]|nr:hypothetical protein N0V82_000277 [Gnomoniopsis sp. IMI 355080]